MPSPCRVLILNERDPRHPAAGGAEVHIAEISRRMAAMGFELTQAAVGFPGAPAREHVRRPRGAAPRAHPLLLPARRRHLRARDAPRPLRRRRRAPEQAALLRAGLFGRARAGGESPPVRAQRVPPGGVADRGDGRGDGSPDSLDLSHGPRSSRCRRARRTISWRAGSTPIGSGSSTTASASRRSRRRRSPRGRAASRTSAGSNATSASTCCCERSRRSRRASPRSRS